MLEVKDISYVVDNKVVLDKVNLTIKPGLTVITGPNGAGKSTLSKVLMGIVKPTSGSIIYNGEDITNLSIDERAKKGFAFSFQTPGKFKGITVGDLITLSSFESESFISPYEILSDVGLCAKDYVNREIDSSLSGGELKRIEIASALVREAKVNIFDEPEAGIDLWSFNNLISVFEKLEEKTKGSILIISHQERILEMAQRIIVITSGKITNDGTKEDVLPGLLSQNICKTLADKM